MFKLSAILVAIQKYSAYRNGFIFNGNIEVFWQESRNALFKEGWKFSNQVFGGRMSAL